MTQETLESFQRLSDILDTLRKECPWDKAQTLASLRYLTIEEVYELSEALLKVNEDGDEAADAEFKKELGDLFMHLLFYSKIAEEEHRFSAKDVFDAISEKLIARHPFIYKKDEYGGESWEQIKMHEGRKSVLEGVPAGLPSLVKAVRLQEKAAGIGYTMPETAFPLPEEMDEEQFGTYMFQLVHWAHERGINADDALSKADLRFKREVSEFEEDKRSKNT